MTTVAQTTNRTVALDDSQRTRCEVWTLSLIHISEPTRP